VAGGTAWSACEGQVLPREEACSKPGDEDCDGVVCLCWPGQEETCEYGGPAGTEGVGACRASTRTCDDSGKAWGACTGEVTPLPQEDCTTPGDDDCDGTANEGTVCVCVPNSSQSCYSGPTGTQGVGMCQAGTQQCNALGTAWEACTGEVTPQPEEDCTTPGDDDCDGTANEGTVCVCVPNSSQSCYSGPTGTQGVGVCQAGTQQCNALGTAWEACTGEVTPQAERCTDGRDDDCDGQIDEAPPCGWVAAGAMSASRRNHMATLLNDGRVLVSGGTNSNTSAHNTAEVYDPATNAWSSAGTMASTHHLHTATLLGNGKVLVTGGDNGNLSGTNSTAEVYDPATNTWSSGGTMA
jgi:Galactose oxidase, central domain/Kelch motif